MPTRPGQRAPVRGGRGKGPEPDTCAACHEARVRQFKQGKHAAAWIAMRAMPTIHAQPMALVDGQKGCGGCHKIGAETADEIKDLASKGGAFGVASCDSCHTRHVFSVAEARQPQACQTCHMGFDHPQWEMYATSKHGVRCMLKQTRSVPATVVGPSCQTCHMPDGNHEVRTAWGFLAVRMPLPADKQWAADRTLILQALGILDPDGRPTARLGAVKAADIARFTEESWRKERDKMIAACREDAPTVIEQRLFVMVMEHRMRAFQGAFHASPDYALWSGWSELRRALTEIQELAADMRAIKPSKPARGTVVQTVAPPKK